CSWRSARWSPCRRRAGAARSDSRHCRPRTGPRARRAPPPSSAPRRAWCAPRPASGFCRYARVLRRELLPGALRLGDELAIDAVEIEPAHHGRLLDQAHAGRALLVRRDVLLDALEAAFAVLGIGHDVQGEERDLVLGKAVLLQQGRRGLAVDARHL